MPLPIHFNNLTSNLFMADPVSDWREERRMWAEFKKKFGRKVAGSAEVVICSQECDHWRGVGDGPACRGAAFVH